MNITIYHGHIDHRHGYNHHAATSHEQFFKWAADYCRKSWPEQFDKDDPDHAIPDTDEEIVSMFFERAGDAGMGEGEYFHHDITQIEIPDPAPSPHLLEACQELVKWLYKICTDDVKLVLKHEPTEEHLSLTNIQALLDSIQNPACNASPGKVELATYSVQICEEIVETRDFKIQARSAAHAHRLAYDLHVEQGRVPEPPAIAVNERVFIITTPSGEEKEFLDKDFETTA